MEVNILRILWSRSQRREHVQNFGRSFDIVGDYLAVHLMKWQKYGMG
ncbi:hypothetical protein HMPREF3191_00045 [Veillonellaceae bacterium DNF00626]|nr:hypothetical protein HMPREF3191_00045 [Veillonellaceae bacterium DNF00626]